MMRFKVDRSCIPQKKKTKGNRKKGNLCTKSNPLLNLLPVLPLSTSLAVHAPSFESPHIQIVWLHAAEETKKVTACCASEALCTTLPVLFVELEKCQKSLEGYLEQKRSRFPRFYFVSNPVLLLVLSQGSDPVQMQPYYEKVFDSISQVVHDKK